MSAADPAIGALVSTTGTDLARNDCRALYIGGAGDLAVTTSLGEVVTFVGVQAGTILPIRVKRVNTSGTTATNILALY
jgi:hypothetical protein